MDDIITMKDQKDNEKEGIKMGRKEKGKGKKDITQRTLKALNLQSYDPNYVQAVRSIGEIVAQKALGGEEAALQMLYQDIINMMLLSERETYIKRVPSNPANGFYDRTLSLSFGKLEIKVPRVRIGSSFRPALLPERWKRVDKSYENIILAFLANGYSKEKMKRALKALNLPYSEEVVEELVDLIYEHLQFYKSDLINKRMFAVFIDAYHAKLREENGVVKDISLYIGVGITLDGYKKVLGWWIKKGKESVSFWIEVMQDMISRGLSEVGIFVTDDFPGVGKAIKKLFPLADHQLCMVHLKRHLRSRLSKDGYREASKKLTELKRVNSYEEGKEKWEELVKVVAGENARYGERLKRKEDEYIAFVKWPEEVRKYIYTTNIVESINSGIELMRQDMGGYFQSEKVLEVNLFVQLTNLNDRWMRKPVAVLRGNAYRIQQPSGISL